jgi:hypothetical protein
LPADATARPVVEGVASSELRRAPGPASSIVPEERVLRSNDTRGQRVARISVRALASRLGLVKGAAARASCRHRDIGPVTAAPKRTDARIFDTGTYVAAADRTAVVASTLGAVQHSLAIES